MKYQLTTLEQLVETVNPEIVNPADFARRQDEWLKTFREEKERIVRVLMNKVFDVASDSKRLEVYVQQHQHGITALAIILFRYISLSSKERQSFYTSLCEDLKSLLSYILRHCDKYLDLNLPLPHNYSTLVVSDLEGQLQHVEEHFRGPEWSSELLDLALNPIRDFVHNKKSITYRRLLYYQELLYQISLLSADHEVSYMMYHYQLLDNIMKEIGKTETKENVKINILLLYMNFNAPDYIAYCIAGLNRKFGDLPNPERLRIMRIYRKFITHVKLKPSFSFMPEIKESTLDQLQYWIEREIEYLEREQLNGNEGEQKSAPNEPTDKIRTSLSAKELAVFIRLFAEAKIITNQSNREVYRAVSQYFTTTGTDGLTFEGIRSRNYNLSRNAVYSVKERLLTCVNILQRWLNRGEKLSFLQ